MRNRQCRTWRSDRRICPAQPPKPGHVGIGREKLSLVLDRKGGETRVLGQIAGRSHRLEKVEQDVSMTVSRVDKRRLRTGELRPYMSAGATHIEWIHAYFSIGCDANEAQDRHPG